MRQTEFSLGTIAVADAPHGLGGKCTTRSPQELPNLLLIFCGYLDFNWVSRCPSIVCLVTIKDKIETARVRSTG